MHSNGFLRTVSVYSLTLLFLLSSLTSCQTEGDSPEKKSGKEREKEWEAKRDILKNPLPSWRDSTAKNKILDFVKQSCDEDSPTFIPVEDRIAVYDNDGTLWNEKPLYVQLAFSFDRIKALAEEDPTLATKEPYRSIVDGDFEALGKMDEHEIIKAAMLASDMQSEEFATEARLWFQNARHMKFDTPYSKAVYQPMIELLDFMEVNGFKNFICTGGGIEFVRQISSDFYDIPTHRVIGSSINYEYDTAANTVNRIMEISSVNDKAGKPANIMLHIGKVPVVAVGNSDGDFEMMRYSETSRYPTLQLLVHHDDSDREYEYTDGAEKAQKYCAATPWVKVSMKNDFEKVFPD